MFRGHFRMVSSSLKVRVDIKPSELSSRLPHPGLSCQRLLVGGLHSADTLPGLSTNRPGKGWCSELQAQERCLSVQ